MDATFNSQLHIAPQNPKTPTIIKFNFLRDVNKNL